MTKFAAALLVTFALTMSAPSALAEKLGWFAGGSAGFGKGDVKDGTVSAFAAAAGISPASTTVDGTAFAFKVFVGYSMSQYLGFEGGIFSLGSRGWKTIDATTGGALSAETETVGANLDVVGSLPLGNWRLFARGGGYYGNSKLSFESEAGAPIPATEPGKNRFNWKVGAGVGYEFASNVAFRAEWERYRVDVGNGDNIFVDVVSGSVLYRF
jgi:opacity protein-like surface antigen